MTDTATSETRAAGRAHAVAAAMADIRAIAPADANRDQAERILARLIELAAHDELFPVADFPSPPADDKRASRMYRVAEDDDHRFALYVNSCRDKTEAPVHDHTTWAVIAGIQGQELNRFYVDTADGGIEQTDEKVVEAGTGVALIGTDLHSIHIDGGALNFHCYGRGLEQLADRRWFKKSDSTWHTTMAPGEIAEARPGRR
ncbi:MAG: cysteine dioxygenase [Actinomycetia bacterium]|nr:cysteine dioxygenase [Actinomycetes bacterium]